MIQIFHLVKPEKEKPLLKLVSLLDNERKIQQSESLKAYLIVVIIKLKHEVDNGLLPITKITESYNTPVKDKFQISPRKVGWCLRVIGLKKRKLNKAMCIGWDDKLINRLSEQFGLDIYNFEEVEPIETSNKEKPRKRHERHSANNNKCLKGENRSDVSGNDGETSQKCHSENDSKYRESDGGGNGDNLSKRDSNNTNKKRRLKFLQSYIRCLLVLLVRGEFV